MPALDNWTPMDRLIDAIDDEVSEHVVHQASGECLCGDRLSWGSTIKHRHGNPTQAIRAHVAQKVAQRLVRDGLAQPEPTHPGER